MAVLRKLYPALALIALLLPFSAAAAEPETVRIDVQAARDRGAYHPIWNNVGYDEAGYTYMKYGPKLLHELAALSPAPVYIRTHNLLTSGDGTASFKWSSTNAYTEDAAGKPHYDWTLLDRIFDTYRDAGVCPLVEVGFMPEALSTHPIPYRHNFPDGPVFTGWSYPPKDYAKWAGLVAAWARHVKARYGEAAVNTWLWEVWNEPDIGYWHGTAAEYDKLYDYTAQAIHSVLPNARVGGPDSTGPAGAKAAAFLRQFLEHCAHGKNAATGRTGAPLAFVSYHPKGSPNIVDGHVEMGINRQLQNVESGFRIVTSFPEWKNTPVILGESDPEGCAACAAAGHPQYAYRNGPLYGASLVEAIDRTYELAHRAHANIKASVTWAFEFPDTPFFAGYRDLATNGIDKPVLNAFRLLGLLSGDWVQTSSSGAVPLAEVLSNGVRAAPDVNAVATRSARSLAVLVWNYHDDDVAVPDAPIDLNVAGLPAGATRVLVEHFRMDAEHSNAYSVWKSMGEPQTPTSQQYAELEAAGQLATLTSPKWKTVANGALRLRFSLPRQAVSLVRITW